MDKLSTSFINFLLSLLLMIVCCMVRLLMAEKVGKLCRDDSVEGLRFYPNKFLMNL